jgi:hypothetical protein
MLGCKVTKTVTVHTGTYSLTRTLYHGDLVLCMSPNITQPHSHNNDGSQSDLQPNTDSTYWGGVSVTHVTNYNVATTVMLKRDL